jgi:hypothetical protein
VKTVLTLKKLNPEIFKLLFRVTINGGGRMDGSGLEFVGGYKYIT